MISALEAALVDQDSTAVQDAIFELGKCRNHEGMIDDEIAFQVLAVLGRPLVWSSPLAGHILNFFEFEEPRLSQRAKNRCEAFLREWGNQFTDVHSVQVVGELLHGTYLKPIPPKPLRKKPRHIKRQY